MRKLKYKLPTNEADLLVDAIVLKVIATIPTKRITIDEQHARIHDITMAIRDLRTFKKPTSAMKLKAIQDIASKAITQITKVAEGLAKAASDDQWERSIALGEYRIQLRAALVSRLILIRAHDGIEKWRKAREAGIKIALTTAKVGGAAVIGAAAILIVAHMLRGEDPEKAHERGARKAEKKRKEAEEKARQDQK